MRSPVNNKVIYSSVRAVWILPDVMCGYIIVMGSMRGSQVFSFIDSKETVGDVISGGRVGHS